jgi:hypothetical protein
VDATYNLSIREAAIPSAASEEDLERTNVVEISAQSNNAWVALRNLTWGIHLDEVRRLHWSGIMAFILRDDSFAD